MCGIVGITHLDGRPIGARALDRFTDSLAHRGPDGRGTFVDGATGIGHRRLSILDLSTEAAQPLRYEGRWEIALNGEIYNFLELRDELVGLGHRFRTDGDTEVAVAAFAQWGDDFQRRLNGMWAMAIWDRATRTLFLSRDRFGEKPLFYVVDDRRFAFASEMKAFLALEGFVPRFDPAMIARGLSDCMGVETNEWALLDGVRRLMPGHSLTLREGGRPRVRRWWRLLDHREPVPVRFSDQVEMFRERLAESCRLRMRSDVALGATLSGGLDSSAVLGTAAALDGRRMSRPRLAAHAFFPGGGFDERPYARAVAEAADVPLVEVPVDARAALADLDRVIFDFEEIYSLPTAGWLTYREMKRRGVTVSLDGQGADELLAGYPGVVRIALRDALLPRPRPRRAAALCEILAGLQDHDSDHPRPAPLLATMREELKMGALVRLGEARRALPIVPRLPVASERWLRVSPRPLDFSTWEADCRDALLVTELDRKTYWNFQFAVIPTVVRGVDRLSMAHGVEVRIPFLDWKLVRLAFSLPIESKLGDGVSKRVLREAMRGVLPESVRARRGKVHFHTPVADWLDGPFGEYFFDMLASRAFRESAMWDGPRILRETEEAYRLGRRRQAAHAWPFVQTMRLMSLFTAGATRPLSPGS